MPGKRKDKEQILTIIKEYNNLSLKELTTFINKNLNIKIPKATIHKYAKELDIQLPRKHNKKQKSIDTYIPPKNIDHTKYIKGKTSDGKNRYDYKELNQVIINTYLRNNSIRKTAEELGISVASVNNRLKSEISRLKDTTLREKIEEKKEEIADKILNKVVKEMESRIDDDLKYDDFVYKLRSMLLKEVSNKIIGLKDKTVTDRDITKLQEMLINLQEIDVNSSKKDIIEILIKTGFIKKTNNIENKILNISSNPVQDQTSIDEILSYIDIKPEEDQ